MNVVTLPGIDAFVPEMCMAARKQFRGTSWTVEVRPLVGEHWVTIWRGAPDSIGRYEANERNSATADGVLREVIAAMKAAL